MKPSQVASLPGQGRLQQGQGRHQINGGYIGGYNP